MIKLHDTIKNDYGKKMSNLRKRFGNGGKKKSSSRQIQPDKKNKKTSKPAMGGSSLWRPC